MNSILLFAFILMMFPQGPAISSEGTPVEVVSFKWFKDRQVVIPPPANSVPAPPMIAANKNFEKNRRANAPPGDRDPNLDTLEGRSAAMERAVQESRAAKPLDGFGYRAKVHNASDRLIEIIFWEYRVQESSAAAPLTRRQFLCGVSIKPERDKELQAFSLSGPHDVVSVKTLSQKSANATEEVVINRVEYADGSIWQRKGWSLGEVRLSYARAVATPWGAEMCRGL